jgi:predicted RNA-binding protein (virulence factor B family)
MIEPGKYNTLRIDREVDFGVYLVEGEHSILLPKKYLPENCKVGDMIKVFLYFDSEDRIIATTLQPKAAVGDIAVLEATDITGVGAFLDWGLEKDLLVPFREQRKKMELGKKYVVRVCYDQVSDRIFASSRFSPILKSSTKDLTEGQAVDLIVYDEIEIGFPVLINRCHYGMLYKNELFKPVALGDHLQGFISKLRNDGNIDVALQQTGSGGIKNAREQIIDALQRANGSLPFNAKSSSEVVKQHFNMSRKQFKQVIGNLYRERLIEFSDTGMKLVDKAGSRGTNKK